MKLRERLEPWGLRAFLLATIWHRRHPPDMRLSFKGWEGGSRWILIGNSTIGLKFVVRLTLSLSFQPRRPRQRRNLGNPILMCCSRQNISSISRGKRKAKISIFSTCFDTRKTIDPFLLIPKTNRPFHISAQTHYQRATNNIRVNLTLQNAWWLFD